MNECNHEWGNWFKQQRLTGRKYQFRICKSCSKTEERDYDAIIELTVEDYVYRYSVQNAFLNTEGFCEIINKHIHPELQLTPGTIMPVKELCKLEGEWMAWLMHDFNQTYLRRKQE